MENPCLTFVTPTLLAGDRSQAHVVAHEIAHSWSGNLVTNKTWEHFWLNEGWTVWLERKIKGHMKGAAHYDFSAISGAKHLADDVALYGATNPLTHMVPQLRDVDPDDAFSSVPYEKGFNLLHYLSTVVGGAEVFEEFARAYVDHFKFKTLTSADFRAFFMEWCRAREIDASAVDWDAWLMQPGMPPVTNTFSNELGAACSALGDRWLAAANEGEPKKTIGGAKNGKAREVPEVKAPKYYPADDIKPKVASERDAASKGIAKLKKGLKPGSVLIMLGGRFRGKRVIFLKQLASGLLLVTGPYKVNGVPMRRMNQAYVIATSTKVNVSAVKVDHVNDDYFARTVANTKAAEGEFFEAEAAAPALSAERKSDQKSVDAAIKLDSTMKAYLNAKFSLKKGQYPHMMKF